MILNGKEGNSKGAVLELSWPFFNQGATAFTFSKYDIEPRGMVNLSFNHEKTVIEQ